ncbi:MAG: transporter substrate-binding domain-containing protein, partial [Motiliproteus sp.]
MMSIRPLSKQFSTGLLLSLALAFCGQGLRAEVITLGANLKCPYVCDESPELPGILVEIAKHAFSRTGHQIQVIYLPWSRALRYAELGEISGVIGVLRRNAPTFRYPKVPQAVSVIQFFTLATSSWEYQGLRSLTPVRIGVTQDNSCGSMDSYIRRYHHTEKVMEVSSESAIQQLLRGLRRGRINALLEDQNVLNYQLQQQGTLIDLKPAGQLSAENMYIAFHPQHPGASRFASLVGNE